MNTLAFEGTKYFERATNLPTISGTVKSEIGHIGNTVELYVGSTKFTVPMDPATGKWTWTSTELMPNGHYSISYSIVDAAKNVSKPSLYTLVVDTTPPESPQLLNLDDNVGDVTGSFDSKTPTDDKRPKLTGLAQKGTTVYLRDASGNDIGSAVADKDTGKWEMEPIQDLNVGTNSLTLIATEVFANQKRSSAPSAPFTITVTDNTLPPNTIAIRDAFDDAGSVTGLLKSGALTDDTTPTLRGDVSAGNTVTVFWRATGSSSWLGSSTATVTGEKWSWTPGSALPVGEYEFQATISGNTSQLFMIDIATSSDIALKTTILYAEDNVGSAQGRLASGAISDDTMPELHGSGEANGKVTLRFTPTGGFPTTVTVDVDSAGQWQWTPASALATGTWTFDVQAQGQSAWQSSFSLNLFDSNSFNPIITGALDNVGAVQDPLVNGSTTDDTTPTLQGRAESNAYFDLRYTLSGGTTTTVNLRADSAGHWTWVAPALANGNWIFEVQKPGGTWSSFALTVSTAPPISAPVITEAWDDFGYATSVANYGTTDDTTPTLRGTGTAGTTIFIESQITGGISTIVGSTTVQANGSWSFTVPQLISVGTWNFHAKAKDSAGQESSWSANYTLNVVAPQNEHFEQNFESLPLGFEVDAKGHLYIGREYEFLNGFSLTTLKGTSSFERTYVGHKSHFDEVNMLFQSGTTLQFDFKGANNYSFEMLGVNGGTATITTYNLAGSIINSSTIPLFNDGSRLFQHNYSNSTHLIGKVELTLADEAGGAYLDNIRWSRPATFASKFSYDFETVPADMQLVGSYFITGKEYEFFNGLTLTTISGQAEIGKAPANYKGFGEQTVRILDKATLELDFNGATSFNFNFQAGDHGTVTINVYNTAGVLIKQSTEKFQDKIYDFKTYEYKGNGQLIGEVHITPNDINGVYIDELNWTRLPAAAGNAPKGISTLNVDEDTAIVALSNHDENTAKISLNDILQSGEENMFIAQETKQILVQGEAGDVVQLKDILPEGSNISEWKHQNGTVTIAGVEYDVYSHDSDAELLVQQGVKTELV